MVYPTSLQNPVHLPLQTIKKSKLQILEDQNQLFNLSDTGYMSKKLADLISELFKHFLLYKKTNKKKGEKLILAI